MLTRAVRVAVAANNRKDYESMLASYQPAVEVIPPSHGESTLGFDAVYRGHDGVRRFLEHCNPMRFACVAPHRVLVVQTRGKRSQSLHVGQGCADTLSMGPDPDKVFRTREEAEALRDHLNEAPPEYGYSPWYLAGPADEPPDEWWVIRSRGLIAEDLDVSAREYEEALRESVEKSASNRDRWRDGEGIEIQEVFLDGVYPDTRLAVVFRAVTSRLLKFGQPTHNCRFGYRVRIWPAEYKDASQEAVYWTVYFEEFLGTVPAGYGPLRGVTPCDPTRINWLRG